jgi:hypothetical protein
VLALVALPTALFSSIGASLATLVDVSVLGVSGRLRSDVLEAPLAVGELAILDVPLEPVDRLRDGSARFALVGAESWDRPELFVLLACRDARSVTSTRPSSDTGRSVITPPSVR